MSSMYKYPEVARLNPEDIKIPNCMYKIPPLFGGSRLHLTMNGDTPNVNDIDVDNLTKLLAQQELILRTIDKLEVNLPKPTESELVEAKLRSLVLRQDGLLSEIDSLESRVQEISLNDVMLPSSGDVCIHVNWSSMPTKIYEFVETKRKNGLNLMLQCHHHSSISNLKLGRIWNDLPSEPSLNHKSEYSGTITVIVKEQSTLEPIVIVDPQNPSSNVHGEENILKLLEARFPEIKVVN